MSEHKVTLSLCRRAGGSREPAPRRQAKALYTRVLKGRRDGYLSIAGARYIGLLTVDLGPAYDEYHVFLSPEPEQGRKHMYNAFALHGRTGQIIVLARDVDRKLAMDIATGRS